ncbi:MAG: lipopolysaccharide biosynthesis protein [Gemmatimonadota bacterium]
MTGPVTNLPDSASGEPELEVAAKRLDDSLVRGVAWTAGVKWLSQLMTWPATVIVARILSPDDYGLVAMGSVYVAFVQIVNEFGLGTAIVNKRSLSEDQIAQIYGLSMLFGCAAFALSAALAYPLALFNRTPAVQLIVMALSVNFFITSFRSVPMALLARDFEFRRSAINEGLGAIVQTVGLVLLAYLGFRHWALVAGFLLANLTTSALACVQRPHRMAWPRMPDIREAVVFGSHQMGSRIGWYLYTYADFFVIGRVLGQGAVGSYSWGWSFASVPVEKVTSLVGKVAPPIFSAVQDDFPSLRRYLSRLAGGVALLSFPAGVGLALVAGDFVPVVLGHKWLNATRPLQILAFFAAFRALVPTIVQAGTAVGLVRSVMRNQIMCAIVLPVAFLIGTHWGTPGVATAWIIVYPLLTLPLFFAVFRRIEMRVGEYASALWPAMSSTLVMVPVVLLVQMELDPATRGFVRLVVEVLAGMIAYAAALFLLHRSEVRSMVQVVRGSMPGTRARAAANA